MKQIENSYDDYIALRAQGEDVVALPSVLGAKAVLDSMDLANSPAKDEFAILNIGRESLAIYQYIVQNGHFYISRHEESIYHGLKEIITSDMLSNEFIQNWWNAVFFKQNGIVKYDEFYDSLRISDELEVTFRDLINSVKFELANYSIIPNTTSIFIAGEYGLCPLIARAIEELVTENGDHSIKLLEGGFDINIDEADYVDFSDRRLDSLSVSVNNGLLLKFLLNKDVRICLPITDVVLQSDVCDGIKWSDMLPVDLNEDYTACNYKFKYLDLTVNCDAFHNIFLICKDIYGNKVVKMI